MPPQVTHGRLSSDGHCPGRNQIRRSKAARQRQVLTLKWRCPVRRATGSEIEVQKIHLMIDNGVNTSRANPNSDEDGNHWVMNCPADLGREAFVVVDLRDEEGREWSEICGFPRGLPWSPKDDRDSWKWYRCRYSAGRLNAAQIASLDTRLEEYAKLAIASNVEVRFSWSGTVRN